MSYQIFNFRRFGVGIASINIPEHEMFAVLNYLESSYLSGLKDFWTQGSEGKAADFIFQGTLMIGARYNCL